MHCGILSRSDRERSKELVGKNNGCKIPQSEKKHNKKFKNLKELQPGLFQRDQHWDT